MELSVAGLNLLKRCEGFRSNTYLDVAGLPTIGYGHRLRSGEAFPNGIAEDRAATILQVDVRDAEQAVARLVRVSLTQGQFDALVDFTFNLGSGRLSQSTLLLKLNAGKYDDAAAELARWDHGVVNGQQEEVAGLKARRLAEFNLWHGVAA